MKNGQSIQNNINFYKMIQRNLHKKKPLRKLYEEVTKVLLLMKEVIKAFKFLFIIVIYMNMF